jgi:hypothetical protein
MAGLIKKFVIGASVAAGMTALTGIPALAASLGGASVSGQHLTYGSDGTTTFLVNNNAANWEAALSGDGNIELAGQGSSADASGFGEFGFDMTTFTPGYTNQSASTLSGTLDGTSLTFSSLTYDDWYGGPVDGYSNFAQKWMTEAWNDTSTGVQNAFLSQGVADVNAALLGIAVTDHSFFRRISDPNVAYVNNDGGNFNFGLAGHYDHETGLKFSEVVKLTIGEGDDAITKFLYGFGQAEESGVYEQSDGVSHSGLYRFTEKVDVPEPSTLLGLMAIGGALAIGKGKKSNKDA